MENIYQEPNQTFLSTRLAIPKKRILKLSSFLGNGVVLILILLWITWQSTLSAQTTIQIGTGTGAPSVGTNPGTGANGTSPYGYNSKTWQGIYTKAMIEAAMTSAGFSPGPAYIHSLGFNVTSVVTGTYQCTGYTVKMANVVQDDVQASYYTGALTTVYGPTTHIFGTGWFTLNFSTPFLWDGVSNICVEVCYTGSAPFLATSYGGCQWTSVGGNAHMGWSQGACGTTISGTKSTNLTNMRLQVTSATPCSGSPDVATAGSESICPGTTTTIGLTGLAGASNYSYLWKYSTTPGGPYSPAAGTNNGPTYTTPNPLPSDPTYYICEVTCDNSGLMTPSNEGSVSYSSFLNCYCNGTYAVANGTQQANRGITRVQLNGTPAINNGVTSANPTYSVYTGAAPEANAGLTVNLSYSLVVTVGSQTGTGSNNQRIMAWIDYNQNGVFESGEALSTTNVQVTAAGASGTINFTVPPTAIPGTTRMRVRHRFGNNTLGTGDACTNLTGTTNAGGAGEIEDYNILIIPGCTAPTVNASASGTSSLATTSATLNWTNGNGDAGRIVVLRQGSAVTAGPVPGSSYIANAAFGSGAQIGSGNYVVYNGTGNNVSITNLLPSTTYHYAIYEYNASGTCYILSGHSGNFTTASCSPTVQASSLSFDCYEHDKMTLKFNRGNGTNVLVLAKAGSAVDAVPEYNTAYTANSEFGAGQQLGSGNFVVYNGNSAGSVSVQVTGLTPGTTYHYRVYEYNAAPNCYSTAPVSTSRATRNGGIYASSTTTQNTASISQGTIHQQVIGLTIIVNGGADPAPTLNSITFTTTGTTNPSNDLTFARVYYTGTSATFASATQFGPTIANPNGSHTVNGSLQLSAGTNYFWIGYDISAGASLGNAIDATISSFNLTDLNGTGNRTPTITSPSGNRTLSSPSYCTASSRAGCASYGYYPIPTFAGYTYNYSCSGNYQNLTGSFTGATVTPGSSYSFSCYVDDWIGLNAITYAWVDWNQNTVFDNPSERIGPVGPSGSVSVNVPVDAIPGITTMRVYMHTEGGRSNPCQTGNGALSTAIGHIIDVRVNVTGTPPPAGGATACTTTAPTVSTPVTYMQGAAASQLSAGGTNLLWYTAATGGTGSGTAPTPSTATAGTVYYYVSQNTGCEGPRTQIAVHIDPNSTCAPPSIVWDGSASNAWDNASNWTPEIVPNSTSTVVIPLVANQPNIPPAVNGAVKDISFHPGATLSIAAGQMLTVAGNWTGSNTQVNGPGTVTFNGSSAQQITGATSWQNLRIHNTAGVNVVSGQQTVNRALELSTGTFTTNNNLVIRATNLISGYIDNFSGGFNGQLGSAETVTFNRVFTGGSGYRYMSSPIEAGLNVTDFGGFVSGTDNFRFIPNNTPAANFPTCWVFDENWPHDDNSQKGWLSQTTSSHQIETARGYALLMPGNYTVSLTGPPASGNKSVAVTNNYTGFNLLGNPFLSSVNWQTLRNSNSGIAGNTVQFFQASGLYAGQYRSYTYDGSTGFGSDLGGGEFVTGIIPPSQAMFIQATGNGNFAFNQNARVATAETRFFESDQAVARLLRIKVSGGTGSDESMLYFGRGEDSFNKEEDAVKMYGALPGLPNIYTIADSKNLLVNAMATLANDRVIPVGIYVTQAGPHTISFDGLQSFDATEAIWLEDRETGSFTNIRMQDAFTVNLSPGEHNNRFFLHVSPPLEVTGSDETCRLNDGEILISNSSQRIWMAELYNAGDELLASAEIGNGEFRFDGLEGSDYVLQLMKNDGYTVRKVISLERGAGLSSGITSSAETVAIGEPVHFSANYTGNDVNYSWELGEGTTLTGTDNIEHVYELPGIYTVKLRMWNEECSGENSYMIRVTSEENVGIEGFEKTGRMLIYPNPGQDVITVQIESQGLAELIEIQDAAGRTIERINVKDTIAENRISLAVSHLRNGVYRLVISGAGSRMSAGFMVVR